MQMRPLAPELALPFCVRLQSYRLYDLITNQRVSHNLATRVLRI